MKKPARQPYLLWSAILAVLALLIFSFVPVALKDHAAPAYAATDSSAAAPAPGVRIASADLLGLSGRLRAVMGTVATLDEDPALKPVLSGCHARADGNGTWPKLCTASGDSFTVVTLVPMGDADEAGFGRYHVGSWPHDAVTATARYTPPSGFIGVTEKNQGTNVSESFTMRDFLTHDQAGVWPKVLVLQPRILDKLELLRAELKKEGLPDRLHVMSGFRTPQYNALGVGKGGRATHSRHTYGDAADVFVDADGNGWMDDLNGDGKVDLEDAHVLKAAAERVEAEYPSLVGGIGAYPSNGVHGPFVHVDARGVKARWGE